MKNKEIIKEQLRLKLISWVSKLIIEWTSRSIEKDRSDLIKDLSNKIDRFYEKVLSDQRKEIIEKIVKKRQADEGLSPISKEEYDYYENLK